MPTGKSTNNIWLQQLDELVPPAGSSFDKAAAWEKLDQRLSGKKKEKKPLWIWQAAAVLVITTGLYFLFNAGHSEKNNITTTKKEGGHIVTGKPALTEKTLSTADKKIPAAVTADNRPGTIPGDLQKKIQHNNSTMAVSNNDTFVPEIMIAQAPPAVDTAVTKAVPKIEPVITKRKMTVVHNNELGSPQIISTSVETNTAVASSGSFIPGFRKPVYAVYSSSNNEESLKEVKAKKAILPFGSLISKKE